MAYQNVGTPRFYINVLEWLASNGAITLPLTSDDGFQHTDLFRTLPVIPEFLVHTYWAFASDSPVDVFNAKSFFAILGLKRQDDTVFVPTYRPNLVDNYFIELDGEISINNSQAPDDLGIYTQLIAPYNGFSIGSFDATSYGEVGFRIDNTSTGIESGVAVGSVILGTYFDMPHSPDLKLTMTREMDGVKRMRTKGGSDLVNHKYIKPAMWGDAGAWELYEGVSRLQKLSRSGRISWDLSFSYLQDSDIFPDVSSLRNHETISPDGVTWDDSMSPTDNTILNEDTFYSQVIHKTNGGQLPFIFQPDNSNNNIDQFAICKFDMNSFEFEQVANGIYNIKLKIREVW